MTGKPTLSKSQYIQGQRCPLALWLAWNRKDLKDGFDPARRARMATGDEIGLLAHEYFGGGVEVKDPYWKTEDAIASTNKFVAAGNDVIYEATAANPDGGYSRVDVLRKVPGTVDEWDMIEVKSTATVKDYHVEDLSFQYHAFTGAGYKIRNCYMMVVNNQYVRQGPVDVQKLLRLEDITDKVKGKEPAIGASTQQLIQIRTGKTPPQAEIGGHCNAPFPCDFKKHCWKSVPLTSVFNVYSPAEAVKVARQTGSYRIEDVPAGLMPEGSKAVDIVSHKTGREHIEPQKIHGFIQGLTYPLYYLDYETIMPAIPIYDGTRPYQHIPFQFSLHVQETPDGPVKHHEFLHKEKTDPREAFVKELIRLCGKTGTVVVYNQEFEMRRNDDLARDFPQYAQELKAINARMVDLYEPFKNRWLYSPAQKGSASIKDVLPAFTKLNYDQMAVHDGPQAMGLYTQFVRGQLDISRNPQKFWDGLSRYCRMDTYAMVALVNVLRERVKNQPPGLKPS